MGNPGRMLLAVALTITSLLAAALIIPAGASTATPVSTSTAPSCSSGPLVVGTVACGTVTTHMLGDGIQAPFGYYIPPECAPGLGVKCPVLYLMHGFGGDFTEMVGTPSQPSAWVSALTSKPPPGFQTAPWLHADPAQWVPATPLPLILIAPRGQTAPGGYGPAPGLDSYWVDWNPRYAKGGDSPRYDTPPPRFESFLLDELMPYVAATFPTGTGRQWQAIGGVSLGGYGSYKTGLHHPDVFSSMVSVSGAMNFLFAPAPPAIAVPVPVQLPHVALPALTGLLPRSGLPSQAQTFLTALDALGDPVADQAYFRGNMPTDLALNGSSLAIDGFVNDTIPRRQADLSDPVSIAFEDIVFPMNLDMELDFALNGVPNTFAIHQGLHSDVYRNAWLRGLEEFTFAHLSARAPASFNYRSISSSFSIWGWSFSVQRPNISFLTLRGVTCHSLSLQGTGRVTITPPPSCGKHPVTVDLGPSAPIDDPLGLGGTRTVTLS